MSEVQRIETIVALYTRVSTEQQDHELQRRDLMAEVARMGYRVYDEYSDTITGASETRQQLDRMTMDAKNGCFNKILIWKLDRLSRNIRIGLNILHELEDVANLEINFILEPFINTSRANPTMPEMARNMILMGAQMELKSIRERTRAAKTASIKANKWPSPHWYPLGYKLLKPSYQLEVDPKTAPIVKRIFSMYLDDMLSVRQICKQLDSEGIPGFRGQKWNKDGVQNLLANEVYIGKKPIKGKKLGPIHTFICQPIISEERFNECSKRRLEQQQRSKRRPTHGYPFRQYLICANCGYDMHAITSRRSDGKETYHYGYRPSAVESKYKKRCPDGCGRVSEIRLVEGVWTHLIELILNNSVPELKALFLASSSQLPSDKEMHSSYKAELADVELEEGRVLENYERGLSNKERMQQRLLSIQARKNVLYAKIRSIQDRAVRDDENERLEAELDRILLVQKKWAHDFKLVAERVWQKAGRKYPHYIGKHMHVRNYLKFIKQIQVDCKARTAIIVLRNPKHSGDTIELEPDPILKVGRPPKGGGSTGGPTGNRPISSLLAS